MGVKRKISHIIGIDEAGRGPLAGPVAVGVVAVPKDFDWDTIPGVNDSKKVTEKNREAIFLRAHQLRRQHEVHFSVALVSAAVIDRIGIVPSVSRAIIRGLATLDLDCNEVEVRLDGLLHAPQEYRYQETIIKGDEKEKVIGLASILAKVTRDRLMRRLGMLYPSYNFHAHKGYATRKHREVLSILGFSPIHRRSYCSKILPM
jgi:ribonuclease HII